MGDKSAHQGGDLTRKERRERARAQRKAIEEAQRASATRRRRLMQLGGVATLVVVIIVAIALATGGSNSSHLRVDKNEASATVAEVSSLLDGIPQQGNRLGDPRAPVTLEYYGDLECPYCRDFTVYSLPTLITEFVRPGKLKIEYHAVSTATGNAESSGAEAQGTFKNQQVAALAAGQQGKMWYFIELFYHEQGAEDSGYVNESFIQGIAQQVPGLNLPDWTTARGDSNLAAQIASDAQSAAEHHFAGTPSFLLGRSGTMLAPFETTSFTEPAVYAEAIRKYLS